MTRIVQDIIILIEEAYLELLNGIKVEPYSKSAQRVTSVII